MNVHTVRDASVCKISVSNTATISDIKKEIARTPKGLAVERQSIRTDIKGKDVDNSKTVSSLQLESGSTIYVKDLGPQIGWRTVYLIEYLGPPIVYAIFAYRPWIIYGDRSGPVTTAAQ